MLKVYVAGSWNRKNELKTVGEALNALPETQTVSSWLWSAPPANYNLIDGTVRDIESVLIDQDACIRDCIDMDAADVFVLQTEDYGVYTTGARLVEFGYMLRRLRENSDVTLMLVGRRENVFAYYPGTTLHADWDSAIKAIATIPRKVETS